MSKPNRKKKHPKTKVPKRKPAKRSMSKKSPRKHKPVSRKSAGGRSFTGASAVISGTFEGDIMADGHLCIGKGAKCNANVKAPSVQVEGAVKGLLVAKNTMKLGSNCHVNGTIVADKLVCSNGASFFGTCKLGKYKKAA